MLVPLELSMTHEAHVRLQVRAHASRQPRSLCQVHAQRRSYLRQLNDNKASMTQLTKIGL